MAEKKMKKLSDERAVTGKKSKGVEVHIDLDKSEVLHFSSGDYVAVELVYRLMRGYSYDIKNRLRVSLSRGKFNDFTLYGVRCISLAEPMHDVASSVQLSFTVH